MSAPKVGDRVRVIAGQWTGWEGVVTDAAAPPYLWVDLEYPRRDRIMWSRTLTTAEVEVIEP